MDEETKQFCCTPCRVRFMAIKKPLKVKKCVMIRQKKAPTANQGFFPMVSDNQLLIVCR